MGDFSKFNKDDLFKILTVAFERVEAKYLLWEIVDVFWVEISEVCRVIILDGQLVSLLMVANFGKLNLPFLKIISSCMFHSNFINQILRLNFKIYLGLFLDELRIISKGYVGWTRIIGLGTLSDFRNKGLAKQLIKDISRKEKHLLVTTYSIDAAQRFYPSCGFSLIHQWNNCFLKQDVYLLIKITN